MDVMLKPYFEKWAESIQPDHVFKFGALSQELNSAPVLVEKQFRDMNDTEREIQFNLLVYRILNEYFSNK